MRAKGGSLKIYIIDGVTSDGWPSLCLCHSRSWPSHHPQRTHAHAHSQSLGRPQALAAVLVVGVVLLASRWFDRDATYSE